MCESPFRFQLFRCRLRVYTFGLGTQSLSNWGRSRVSGMDVVAPTCRRAEPRSFDRHCTKQYENIHMERDSERLDLARETPNRPPGETSR